VVALRTENAEAALADLTHRIGGHVRALRRHRGMSRRRLSDVSGVSERYLAQLEGGTGNVTIGILHRLSLVFDCAVESLVAAGARGDNAKAQRIALLGVRGGGKTTLGKAVSAALDVPFIEVTSQIEAISGMDVGEVISLYGQDGYRRYEEEAIASIIEEHDRAVIAVGGGIVEVAASYDMLLQHFHTILVEASPAEHIARVRAQGDERPMQGFATAEAHLRTMLHDRQTAFARADHNISTAGKDVADSTASILALIDDQAFF
jgi:XRE family aerobic/anaerobic benzoate catabolism transcriptional regulator